MLRCTIAALLLTATTAAAMAAQEKLTPEQAPPVAAVTVSITLPDVNVCDANRQDLYSMVLLMHALEERTEGKATQAEVTTTPAGLTYEETHALGGLTLTLEQVGKDTSATLTWAIPGEPVSHHGAMQVLDALTRATILNPMRLDQDGVNVMLREYEAYGRPRTAHDYAINTMKIRKAPTMGATPGEVRQALGVKVERRGDTLMVGDYEVSLKNGVVRDYGMSRVGMVPENPDM